MSSLEELLGTEKPPIKEEKKKDNLADALGLGNSEIKSPVPQVNEQTKPELNAEPTAANLIDAAEFHVKNQPENFKEEQVRVLRENLDILQNSFDDKDLIGKALYTIVDLLRQHPFLKDNISEDDMASMVKTLRSTYQTVVMNKKKKTTKKTQKSMKQAEISQNLEDLDFGDVTAR